MNMLVVRIGMGDEHAFAQFRLKTLRLLTSLCHQHEIPASQIQDVEQETYFKLWVNREQFSKARNWNGYFFKVVQNLLNDHREKRRLERHIVLTDPLVLSRFTLAITLASTPAYHTLEKLVLRCISQLPEKQQQVVACKWAGLSRQEIVGKLGMRPGTVDRNLQEGKKKVMDIVDAFNREKIYLLSYFFILFSK
jgi:RNA polymerase sigma factor (sigma-70 family)